MSWPVLILTVSIVATMLAYGVVLRLLAPTIARFYFNRGFRRGKVGEQMTADERRRLDRRWSFWTDPAYLHFAVFVTESFDRGYLAARQGLDPDDQFDFQSLKQEVELLL